MSLRRELSRSARFTVTVCSSAVQQITGGALRIQQGAFYPALYRLERQELIDSEWGTSDNSRCASSTA